MVGCTPDKTAFYFVTNDWKSSAVMPFPQLDIGLLHINKKDKTRTESQEEERWACHLHSPLPTFRGSSCREREG